MSIDDFEFEELSVDKVEAGQHVYAKSSRGLRISAWVQSVTRLNGNVESISFRDAGTVEVRAPHFADLRFYVVKK